jgi:hypothetical protein
MGNDQAGNKGIEHPVDSMFQNYHRGLCDLGLQHIIIEIPTQWHADKEQKIPSRSSMLEVRRIASPTNRASAVKMSIA